MKMNWCLHEFLAIQNSKKEIKLFAFYFLSGFIVKDGFRCRKIIIVPENKLEEIKKAFDEVVSIHIYSLNKGDCRDVSSLYNSQSWCKKWAEEHREYSAIKHPNIKIQAPIITKAELKKSDVKTVFSKPVPAKTKKDGMPSMFQSNKKEVKSDLISSNSEIVTSEAANNEEKTDIESKPSNGVKSKSEVTDPKKSTLSSMWQKLEDKTKDGKNENSKTESKGKNKGASKTVGKNNIMSMFSKQAEKNAANPPKKTVESVVSPVKTAKHSPEKVEKEEEKKVVPTKNKSKTTKRKTKQSSKKASDNDSDEDSKPKKKKHRRIMALDDSESESDNEEERDRAQRSLTAVENEDVPMAALSDDNEEPIPPTPPVVLNRGKSKVWKTVQKTYQDEDGFLVAKQEKVLVSASESDEEPLPTKSNVKKEDSKQNTFQYRKQASLTSFFNKR